ncbi:hypothetical protein GCM10023258_23630 [Terrabacter aeriphilus]|uniref:Lysylphosphatidylglycerol synthase-like protein n=1 Tax=Terrabacter aeriphilus TaxID=515662 RepID=A0ABP9JD30_9MICO
MRLRPVGGLAILAVLVWRVGGDAFLTALGRIHLAPLALAAAIVALTTVLGAWRWVLVARALGTRLRLGDAVAECYRSQLLNVTLPGGVLGDVNRGVRHGNGTDDLARGLRGVVWERTAGQVVLVVVATGVLLVEPSRALLAPTVVGVALLAVASVGLLVVLFLLPTRSRRGEPTRLGRAARTALGDVRAGLHDRHTSAGVLVASLLVVAGHVGTFVLAARTAGVTAPTGRLVPLALVALVAMGLPLNVAGWGPREGVAAWSFGVAGLGAGAGVTTAVVYGVMTLVAVLPGLVLLVAPARWPWARWTSARRVAAAHEGGARG